MPYNKTIEARIERIISSWQNTDSKKMFGGVCHLLNGNMFCGVHKDFLILRLGKENADKAMTLPAVRPFDITGKPMGGWVMVEQGGFKEDETLETWLKKARDFAGTLKGK
jgi:hypothetical protein